MQLGATAERSFSPVPTASTISKEFSWALLGAYAFASGCCDTTVLVNPVVSGGDEWPSWFTDAAAVVDLAKTTARIDVVGTASTDDNIAGPTGCVVDDPVMIGEPGTLWLGYAQYSEPIGTGAAYRFGVPVAASALADGIPACRLSTPPPRPEACPRGRVSGMWSTTASTTRR